MKIEIIADDFTGANDIGIQLRKYGLKVTSVMRNSCEIDSDVTVISSETRNKNSEEAYEKVKVLFQNIKKNGYDKFYKKIDSTLRGPVKAELNAIKDLLDKKEKIAVVVGFPKTNRKIIDGKHYIGEEALHETQFKNDPVYPIKTNDMLKYFGGRIITIDEIRGDLNKVLKEINEQVLVFDTETESDLDLIAGVLAELKMDRHVVGSSGIMEHLMKYWGYSRERVMIVAGSCNTHNMEQVEYFLENNFENIDIVELEPLTRSVKGKINSSSDILVRSIREISEMHKTLEKYNFTEVGDFIANEVLKIVELNNIKNMVICGGETSLKILAKLNINYLEIQREVDTGISLGKYEEFRIITKPGGFGQKNFYKIAYEELKNADIIK